MGGFAQSAAKLLVHQSAKTAQKWKPDSNHKRITTYDAHTHRHGVQAEVFASTDRVPRRRFTQLQNAAVAQLDRALVSEAEGCGFDPRRLHSLEISESPYLSASRGGEARFPSNRVNSHSNPLMLEKAATNGNIRQRTAMRNPFRVKHYRDKNRPSLKFVINFKEGANRKRAFFSSKTDAETFANQKLIAFKNQGFEGAEFPSALRVMALECANLLGPFEKTIRDATEHYLQFLRATSKSCTVLELSEQMQSAKTLDGASKSHLHDLKCRLKRFAQDFGSRIVATFTTAEVDEWLRKLNVAPQGRNNYRSAIRSFFNFGIKRNLATSNPAANTEKAKVVSEAPGILTVPQCVSLLDACAEDTLPFVAISLFAGLRAAEVQKLDWAEVDFDSGHIEVTASKAKTARRRLIPISSNLAKWLKPYTDRTGAVVPIGLRKRFESVKERAALADWPQNAMRHSYASYRLAECQDAARVSLEMGNSPQMIFAHYRELVKPKDAALFWKIVPTKTKLRSINEK